MEGGEGSLDASLSIVLNHLSAAEQNRAAFLDDLSRPCGSLCQCWPRACFTPGSLSFSVCVAFNASLLRCVKSKKKREEEKERKKRTTLCKSKREYQMSGSWIFMHLRERF